MTVNLVREKLGRDVMLSKRPCQAFGSDTPKAVKSVLKLMRSSLPPKEGTPEGLLQLDWRHLWEQSRIS
jgi:hypothetical protein